MSNKFTLKQGAVGTVMEFTLTDADGPANLTGWTVTIIAKKGTSDPVIDGDACVMTDAAVGEGTYTFSTDSAAVPIGEYKLEFKATNGANVQYFPTNRTVPYGKLYVVASLG